MPLLINVFMEGCPSQSEHRISCVSACLIGSVFGGGGGVCLREGERKERMHIYHGTHVDAGSSISSLYEVLFLVQGGSLCIS